MRLIALSTSILTAAMAFVSSVYESCFRPRVNSVNGGMKSPMPFLLVSYVKPTISHYCITWTSSSSRPDIRVNSVSVRHPPCSFKTKVTHPLKLMPARPFRAFSCLYSDHVDL